jgi:hypothetical protein
MRDYVRGIQNISLKYVGIIPFGQVIGTEFLKFPSVPGLQTIIGLFHL